MKVLVVLASYNGDKYILDQLNSILNQIDVDVMIHVFDDFSNDFTCETICSINDPRIILTKSNTNSGSAALNFLNSLCSFDSSYLSSFDFISFADQDDIWINCKLINAIRLLKFDNSDLYASDLTIWDTQRGTKTKLVKSHTYNRFDYLFEGASAGCTYVFSIKLALDFINHIKFLDFKNWKYISHDWVLYFYARYRKYKVSLDSESYILYRIHTTNVHGGLNLISFDSIYKKIRLFYSDWYEIHTLNFMKFFLNPTDEEALIYKYYNLNWASRIYVLLKYNFRLMRSKKKYFVFLFLNLFKF